ncbi:MAG: type II toxin-antitoxin system VapC family toxin [Chloroflexi bacterium]|nr:type II toxin-antitoxin system VapC family toxin [Chloroflexota bacterium]
MPDYLLDTNILIYQLRGNQKINQLLFDLNQQAHLTISAIARTEILAGMRPNEEEPTLALLNSLVTLPLDSAVADRAGRLIYQYGRQGLQLTIADALIGATALEHRLILVTTNAKHFPMPELQLHLVKQSEL